MSTVPGSGSFETGSGWKAMTFAFVPGSGGTTSRRRGRTSLSRTISFARCFARSERPPNASSWSRHAQARKSQVLFRDFVSSP